MEFKHLFGIICMMKGLFLLEMLLWQLCQHLHIPDIKLLPISCIRNGGVYWIFFSKPATQKS